MAQCQRRSDLRHARHGGLTARADEGDGGSFHDTDTRPITRRRFSLHHERRHALRDRTCLACQRRGGDPLAGPARGKRTRGSRWLCWAATQNCRFDQRADGLHVYLPVQPPGKVCLRASGEVSARGPLKRTSTESLREKRYRDEAFLCFVSNDDERQGAVKKVQRMKSLGASVYSITSSRRPKPFDGRMVKKLKRVEIA